MRQEVKEPGPHLMGRAASYPTRDGHPLPPYGSIHEVDPEWRPWPGGVEKPLLPTDSERRKRIPMARGLLDYFPAALAAVAEVSFIGNEKHNSGQPLHWSRDKSTDHADCIIRHLAERGQRDPETGLRHSAAMAWRALALLQLELEEAGEAGVAVTPIDRRGKPE